MKSCGAGRRQSRGRIPSLSTFSSASINSNSGDGTHPASGADYSRSETRPVKMFHSLTRHSTGVQSTPLLILKRRFVA